MAIAKEQNAIAYSNIPRSKTDLEQYAGNMLGQLKN